MKMKKILVLFICMLTGASSAVFGADLGDRGATLTDKAGTAWEITRVFIYTEPGGFYESRFCLTVVMDTLHVAIPTENLISVEMEGANCVAVYQWMGKRHRIFGRVVSKLVGGKGRFVYMTRKFKNVKNLTFKEAPMVMTREKPVTYEATLVLKDGTKVPVANLLRVSSQGYPAAPSAGVRKGTLFELYNDIGFLQEKNAPTIKYDDIESMTFPTPNSIMLTFKQDADILENTSKGSMGNRSEKVSENEKAGDDEFLLKALEDLSEKKSDTRERHPKNWTYGFTGIFEKGYFFIDGGNVKVIEFGTTPQ